MSKKLEEVKNFLVGEGYADVTDEVSFRKDWKLDVLDIAMMIESFEKSFSVTIADEKWDVIDTPLQLAEAVSESKMN